MVKKPKIVQFRSIIENILASQTTSLDLDSYL